MVCSSLSRPIARCTRPTSHFTTLLPPARIHSIAAELENLLEFDSSNRLPYMLYTPGIFKCLESRSRGVYFSGRKFGCQTKTRESQNETPLHVLFCYIKTMRIPFPYFRVMVLHECQLLWVCIAINIKYHSIYSQSSDLS